MNAKRALALSRQAGRMAAESHKALPPHPAAQGDSDSKDWTGPLGKAAGKLFDAERFLLEYAKDLAIQELE